ncbi:GIY-YIG nuclease family protein [Vibrio sp. La 4.2.2]|uniref:GIY-YIG nuclease family protein n=1 Tax=Vibrio sp. La 4.2.2 TaxID=2998830 RepID=UPI0022CDC27D|nr:GIY-YIG nuclease family protein [Vibrio sp. La 4.2.2]MDA0107810.1 GIY-YIG nuclease family protein [Vibrio sp. La 4.2.2]
MICVNGLIERDVRTAEYLVYLLDTDYGQYVGETKDLVTRWRFHNHSARKVGKDCGCNDNIKSALLRSHLIRVYVVAVAKSKEEARAKEALAIQYYCASLNSRKETILPNVRAYFNSLERVSDIVSLTAKRNHGNNCKYADSDRETFVCRIVIEKNRKRVKCCSGPFSGVYVECSRSERDRYSEGELVRIKAVLTTKRDKPYLVAAKTSPLVKV